MIREAATQSRLSANVGNSNNEKQITSFGANFHFEVLLLEALFQRNNSLVEK